MCGVQAPKNHRYLRLITRMSFIYSLKQVSTDLKIQAHVQKTSLQSDSRWLVRYLSIYLETVSFVLRMRYFFESHSGIWARISDGEVAHFCSQRASNDPQEHFCSTQSCGMTNSLPMKIEGVHIAEDRGI